MKQFLKTTLLVAATLWSVAGLAAGPTVPLDEAKVDLHDKASLQRGAQLFMNYCLGCHSMEYQRYNRTFNDLGIPEDLGQANLQFTGEKAGDLITNAMPTEAAGAWFGTAAPDLTLVARVRGADWIYTYLRSFYVDESRPFGVNNTVFPNVGMPHVLQELQGVPRKTTEQRLIDGEMQDVYVGIKTDGSGMLSESEYDQAMLDLTNFLVYTGEPMLLEQRSLGWKVFGFLLVFTVIAWLLKREFFRREREMMEKDMSVAANKRSVMTLYSGRNDLRSHQARIVLAEKGVSVEITYVDSDQMPEDLLQLNPYPDALPTLVDRELVLYNAHIIMEYLDERFPHPPLMPVYPVARGTSRLMMYRIERDWFSLADAIEKGGKGIEAARQELREGILALAPIFADTPYFMSEEFTLVDCYLAPLLWRLPSYGISIEGAAAKPIKAYMLRVFERDSFQESLTDIERDLRQVSELTAMTARRPYMLRAVYEWLVDNQLTPHLVVDAEQPGCQVPFEFVKDGQIVLNIAPSAVGNLQLANDRVEFNARFYGKPQRVYVPMIAVVALYARENGAGTIFEEEPQLQGAVDADAQDTQQGPSEVIDGAQDDAKPSKPNKGKRPTLKVIK